MRVLTAESQALRGAVRRALETNPEVPCVSLLDFGYGTGRVTNDFVVEFPVRFACAGKDLRVIAYDVSAVGLAKAAEALCRDHAFQAGRGSFAPDGAGGCLGTVRKVVCGIEVTVVFVHGDENDPPSEMCRLVGEANLGEACLVTTSWYGGLGHVAGENRRREYFSALDESTLPSGEMVLAVSATGDLVQAQEYWTGRLREGRTEGYPIEVPGDVMYETELGQLNYYHLFGPDLAAHVERISGRDHQNWWIEAVRFPDEEFTSAAMERANHRRVLAMNDRMAGRRWGASHYRECHTVAAVRTGSGVPAGSPGW